MKKVKVIDVSLQLILPVVLFFYFSKLLILDLIIPTYIGLGSLQVISFIFPLMIDRRYKFRKPRKIYAIALLILAGISVLVFIAHTMGGGADDILILWLFVLLFLVPVFAVYYFLLCLMEIFRKPDSAV